MKFFLDTANIDEIKQCDELGLLDGVTTNPSLIAKEAKTKAEIYKIYEKICHICKGRPVSCEVVSVDYEGMIKEANNLLKIAENVCIKLPITENGLKACRELSEKGAPVNMTLCFSPLQALLCAKAGATFVSPFLGRLDDISENGVQLISKIRKIFDNYAFDTEILAASIRHPLHIEQVAEIGADIATIPFKTILQIMKHPLTDSGLEKFLKDYNKIA